MAYRLTPQAEADVEAIADYIAAENSSAALRLIERFVARWELLATQPQSGAPRDDLGSGIRHVVTGSYITFYRVDGAGVEIVRVLHGRRAIETDDVRGS